MKHKLLMMLALLLMAVGAKAQSGWDGTLDTDWPSEFDNSSFTISTPQQLAQFACISGI